MLMILFSIQARRHLLKHMLSNINKYLHKYIDFRPRWRSGSVGHWVWTLSGGHETPLPGIRERLAAWAVTSEGSAVVSQLRWAAPTSAVLLSRIRSETAVGRAGAASVLRACAELGIPVTDGTLTEWGHGYACWASARRSATRGCACPSGTATGRSELRLRGQTCGG